MSENPVKVWNRDLAMERRAKTNFMYRVGFLFGILLTWVAVATEMATFGSLSLAAVIMVSVFTLWDVRKIWKGK